MMVRRWNTGDRATVKQDDPGLWQQIEIGGRGHGVGAHLVPDHQIADLHCGQIDVLGDDIDAVAGGARQNAGPPPGCIGEDFQRIVHVVVNLTAEGTIDAVVQIIPVQTLAACLADHGGDTGHGGS